MNVLTFNNNESNKKCSVSTFEKKNNIHQKKIY